MNHIIYLQICHLLSFQSLINNLIKLRKIEKSKYIDRIVHRWYVNSFMEKYFISQFISTSYACIKNKGMHKACLDLQKSMQKAKSKWGYYLATI